MKKKFSILAATFVVVTFLGASAVYAIPTLQLGSYATANQPGQGTYVDYTSNGPDQDTAFITSGNKLLAAGAYGPNTLLVGGQYGSGLDWSDFNLDTIFNGKGAVVMATVAEGSWNNGAVALTLNGMNPFLKIDTFNYPNNHYPVNSNVDFFFYDIGDFNNLGTVLNFADESGSDPGEVKEFTIGVTGLDWIHFDLMALVTDGTGPAKNTRIVTNWDVNPNSKDVTWNTPGTPVPEPATMLLFGAGLAGLAGFARRKVQ